MADSHDTVSHDCALVSLQGTCMMQKLSFIFRSFLVLAWAMQTDSTSHHQSIFVTRPYHTNLATTVTSYFFKKPQTPLTLLHWINVWVLVICEKIPCIHRVRNSLSRSECPWLSLLHDAPEWCWKLGEVSSSEKGGQWGSVLPVSSLFLAGSFFSPATKPVVGFITMVHCFASGPKAGPTKYGLNLWAK